MDGNDIVSFKVNVRCGLCCDLKVGFLYCDIEVWVYELLVFLCCNIVCDVMKVGGILRIFICFEFVMYIVKC